MSSFSQMNSRVSFSNEGTNSGERRSETRVTTHQEASIRIAEGMPAVPCVVNDISKSGARIRFEKMPKLPAQVQLMIHYPSDKHACEVCWIKDNEVGLKFID